MTKDIDLNDMTTDKKMIPEFQDELESKIKHAFSRALVEAAVTEMTKTVRDNEPNKMNINQLYELSRLHFIPERIKFPSRKNKEKTRQRRTSRQESDKRRKTASPTK